MDNFYRTMAAICGAAASFLTGMPAFVWVLAGVMLLDYITGIMCGWKGKSLKTTGGGLSSKAAGEGLLKKGVIILIVLLAALLDLLVAHSSGLVHFSAVTGATCLWYISSEGISILENAKMLGVKIPGVIEKTLEILKDNAGKENEDAAKDAAESDENLK